MDRSQYQEYLASREWAQLREKVRARAGGRCERCRVREMQSTHHLTYERRGHERLEDLLGVCEPCHAFLSAKSDVDPATAGVRVYLAGPITRTTWRDELFADHSIGWSKNGPVNTVSELADWPIASGVLRNGFDFTGPWFVDVMGGHGVNPAPSTHAGPWRSPLVPVEHGTYEADREAVVRSCKEAIERSDIVFGWMPTLDDLPAGTLWELGYAAGLGKFVVLAVGEEVEERSDVWLACLAADGYVVSDDVGKAWEAFFDFWLKSSSRRMKPSRREEEAR